MIAIDILEMEALAGATVLQLDFLDDAAPAKLKSLLRDGAADVVLSDMASPTTGHNATDHLRIMALAEAAALFAAEVLAPGGAFLCKVFQGGTERALLDALKRDFAIVRHVKPPASRKESAELYVLATGFQGRALTVPRRRGGTSADSIVAFGEDIHDVTARTGRGCGLVGSAGLAQTPAARAILRRPQDHGAGRTGRRL